MIGKKDRVNKIIISLFVLVIIFLGVFYFFRENVFQYVDKNFSLGKTSSELISSNLSRKIDFEDEDLLNSDLFNRPKFQNLKTNSISLPRFQTGKNNPFQPF